MLTRLDPNDSTPATDVVPADWLEDPVYSGFARTGNVRQWIDTLMASGHADEALRLMARVLPKPYALAWGCGCLRSILEEKSADDGAADRIGLGLAERCLKSPTEEHRRFAIEFAEHDGFKSAGGWIAAATGWSDGSLAPAGMDPVTPPDTLTGEMVAAALLVATFVEPAQQATRLQAMVNRALVTFGATSGSK
jgi:hypothetical protein